MKDALLHLSLYVLSTVACASAILLALVVMGASPGAVVPFMGPIGLSAWAVGMIPGTLRLLRSGRRPVVTAFLVACLTAGVVSSGILLHGVRDTSPAESRLARSMSEGTVESGRIYQGPDYSIMVGRVIGNELGSVVVADHTVSVDARIQRYSEGYWDRLNNELIVAGGPDIDLDDLRGFGAPVMPAAVRSTVTDVLRLVETATSLWSAPIPFVDSDRVPLILRPIVSPTLIVLMLTLMLIAVWTPLRLTRWPLLNAVAGLAYLRGVAALPVAVERLMRLDLVARWLPGMERTEFVLISGMALVLGLALLALFLPSLANWRHNMHFQERKA